MRIPVSRCLALLFLCSIVQVSAALATATQTAELAVRLTIVAIRFGDADPALVSFELRGGPPGENEQILGGLGVADATGTITSFGPGQFALAPDGTLVGTEVAVGSGFNGTLNTTAGAVAAPDAASVLADLNLSLLVGNLDPDPVEIDLELRFGYAGVANIDSADSDRALARLRIASSTLGLSPALPPETLAEEGAALPIASFPGVFVTDNPWTSPGFVTLTRTYSVPQQSAITRAVLSFDSELFGIVFVEEGAPSEVPTLGATALALLAMALGFAAMGRLRNRRPRAARLTGPLD